MQRETPNKQNKPGEEKKEGYIIMPNNFLAEWIKVIGKGPVLLYVQLLTYCHKEKDIAWPALSTLGDSLDMSKNSLISYQKTLLEYGLIKKTTGRRTAQGNYRSNLYKVTPMRSPKNEPGQVQKLDTGSPKIALDQVQNLHPNNNNLNITNSTATNGEKDAVVAVNFKKLKEKGEDKMRAIRERMVELDFKEEFIEKMLKEYSVKKIEEKLDLLIDKRNIQNPAGWLRTALKNDYRDPEQERYDEEPIRQESQPIPHPHLNPPPSRERKDGSLILSHSIRGRRFVDCPAQKEEEFKEGLETGSQLSPSKWTSREKALEAIGLIRDNLSLPVYPLSSRGKGTIAKLRGG